MNVFDFDGTIYDGDSSLDFWLFCVAKRPSLLRYFPNQICGWLLYKTGRISKGEFKSRFFSFFAGIPKIDVFVKEFWNKNERRIKSWYKRMRRSDDCVVSASPRFLLEEICGRLGIKHLMATEVDTRTGRLLGKNCYGVEKIRRLFFEFENVHVDAFYSDSLSDLPLAQIAEQAYLVRKGVLITWNVAES